METQLKLSHKDPEIFEGRKPEVKVIKNQFFTAGALIKEIIIKKTWVIPRVQNS